MERRLFLEGGKGSSPWKFFLGSLCITGSSCTRNKEGGQKAEPLLPASSCFGKGMGHVPRSQGSLTEYAEKGRGSTIVLTQRIIKGVATVK